MISYYELLGMIKEDKAPRKIRVHLTPGTSKLYVREDDMDGTFSFYGLGVNEKENEEYHFYLPECFLESSMFEQTVEILDENGVPEKLGYFDLTKDKNEKDECGNKLELHYTGVADAFDDVYNKINEILDYLKSKGDE